MEQKKIEEGTHYKPNIWIWIILLSLLLLIVTYSILSEPIEYNIDCSIDGVNVGINESRNFTGFTLNNSEIKCKVDGRAPVIALLGLG